MELDSAYLKYLKQQALNNLYSCCLNMLQVVLFLFVVLHQYSDLYLQ